MVGLGLCLCCKKDKLLTEHHVKKIKENIMICSDCLDVMEGYHKVVEKYSQLIQKDRQPQADKDPSSAQDNEDNDDHDNILEDASNEANIAQPSTGLPGDTAEALTNLIGQYKKKRF